MSENIDTSNSPSEPIKNEYSKSQSSSSNKNTKKISVKTQEDLKKKTILGANDDSFFISPWLILGLFFAALGFGFLLPGVGGPSYPSWEPWSIIFIGLVVSIPGFYTTITKNLKNRKVEASKKTKTKKSQ